MYDVLGDFTKRAKEVEQTLEKDSARLALYRKAIEQIDASKVAQIQEQHRDQLTYFISDDPSVDRAGPEKYFDIPYFIGTRTASVLALGLGDNSTSKNILDIGVGPGHFATLCNALGHRTLGIDIDVQFYPELCEALGVERRIYPVYRLENLPNLGRKFDLVTAIWICFDLIGNDERGHRIYWSLKDWRFLIEDLLARHVTADGEIYFVLNKQVNKDGTTEYDSDLLDWAGTAGATVDRQSGTIHLRKGDYRSAGKSLDGKEHQPPLLEEEKKKQALHHVNLADGTNSNELIPLVFNSPAVPLKALESFGRRTDYFSSVEPFESDQYSLLGTFPIPGNTTQSSIPRAQVSNGAIQFGEFGEFYFYSQIGAFKLLITDPAHSRQQLILDLFRFVARNSVHSCADNWKYQLNGINKFFDVSSLVRKLFFSDQPLMLHCSGISEFLIALLHYHGIEARLVHLLRGENLDGHMVVEAFDNETQRWIFLDPDYGVVLTDSDDRLLSAEDVFNFVSRDDLSFSVVDYGTKCWLRPDRNFPLKFVADATWTPQDNDAARCGEVDRYRKVMNNYVRIVTTYKYRFASFWRGERER